jgi:transcriptional regulator with XRE-family HTH domain
MPHPHPAAAVLRQRRISNRQVARDLGLKSAHHLGRVLNGHVSPSPKLRRALAGYLDLPVQALFRDDEPQDGAA